MGWPHDEPILGAQVFRQADDIRAQGEKTVHDGGAVIRKIRQQLEKPGFAGSHIHHQVFEAPQILGPGAEETHELGTEENLVPGATNIGPVDGIGTQVGERIRRTT